MAFLITAPQRRLLVYLSLGFFVFTLIILVSRPIPTTLMPMESMEHLEPLNSIPTTVAQGTVNVENSRADRAMSYGKYARPIYDGIDLLGNLPHKYIPTLQNKRRLVVVGDIHGMLDSLNAILEKVAFNPDTDHLVALGDMINKGPNSSGTIARLMELNASAVRGNHEDRVILAWTSLNTQFGVEAFLNTEDAAVHRGDNRDIATARSLSNIQMDWIKSLPVILSAEPMSLYMVHAGLAPGVPVEQQDPWTVMNMRSLRFPREEYRKSEIVRIRKQAEKKKLEEEKKRKAEEELARKNQEKVEREKAKSDEEARLHAQLNAPPKKDDGPFEDHSQPAKRLAARDEPLETDTTNETPPGYDRDIWIPIETREGERWTDVWNDVQKQLPASDRRFVVYGHDAKRGFSEDTYTFGLDSGCANGNALTALVFEANGSGGWAHKTVQVDCPEPRRR